MENKHVGQPAPSVFKIRKAMEAEEALGVLDKQRKTILKDVRWEHATAAELDNKYRWVYVCHLSRTYRKLHPFKNMDVDTEHPDGNGDYDDLWPATQLVDPVSDIWAGGGGQDGAYAPAGLSRGTSPTITTPNLPTTGRESVVSNDVQGQHSQGLHQVCYVKYMSAHALLKKGL